MKGKAKLVRNEDGKYYVYAKTYFWQKWKPLYISDDKEISFNTMKEFGEAIKIECFDEITLKCGKLSVLGERKTMAGKKRKSNGNFSAGSWFFGLFFGLALVALWMLLWYSDVPEIDKLKPNEALNSPAWQIDTIQTKINGEESKTEYRFTKKDYGEQDK